MVVAVRPTIANTTMTSADTEYNYTLPAGTIRFEIKLRAQNALLKLAFVSGESGTTYVTIPYGASYAENDVKAGGRLLYFQSQGSSQVCEVKSWIR